MLPIEELKRMVGYISNPPSIGPMAEPIRKALESYTGPRDMKALQEALDFFECAQDPEELKGLLSVVSGCGSLLEVGSRLGGSLFRMANVLAPRSMVVSVDFPMADGTSGFIDPEANLRANCSRIADLGHRVELILGDSHTQGVVDLVRSYGPFDFGFIDADHSYEGVKADWENYGPMCSAVGFHDINNKNEPGCVRLWGELKEKYRHMEIINSPQSMALGIGIIFKDM